MARKKRASLRSRKRVPQAKRGLRARGLELGILLLALILVVFLFSTVRRLTQTQEKPLPVERKIVRVEVLNGCGTPGLAKKVTDFLRIKGFDVVNVGNAENFEFPETLVVDRVGDITSAWKVARAMGVNNVIQQKEVDLLLDVTLILGKDHNELEPFQEILGGD
jgi:hypothetical protein